MADILELVTELEDHVTLARSGLRPEFSEGAIMQATDLNGLLTQPEVVSLEQVDEFCSLLQSSLRRIRKTAEEIGE